VPFVLDASVAGVWASQHEKHPLAALALSTLRTDTALVPTIWWYELRNILLVNERRGRATPDDSEAFLSDLATLSIVIDTAADEAMIFDLARRHRLTFYDAAYLELAMRLRLPLATLDVALAAAAGAEKVARLTEAQ
jgi:predicted nucleic acid-binding protein